MDKYRLNRWLTLGANLGVLVGIIILILELDQNREMMRAQTRNEISVGIVDLLSQVGTNIQLASLLRRADSGEDLTPDEHVQYEHRTAAMFRYFENVHYQYRLGLYDETEYSAHKESWRKHFAYGSKIRAAVWCQYREITSAEFMAEIDSLLPTNSCEPPVSQGAERAPISGGRLLKLEELTYPAIDEIDRDRSIFFLTFGNLEEHGPHIPVGSDYYQANGVRDLLIKRLHAEHPEYDMVVVPVMPLGEGGANNVARQFDHVGTFDIRYSTLRAVTIDMGASIASKGFQNIFLIHHHASPLHNVAFNEASAFVSETYDVNMVNITSLALAEGFYNNAVLDKHLGEGWLQENGIIGHAGTAETSANLFLHDLVNPIYRDLEAFVVEDVAGLFRIRERSGWQGYWSDPSRASAEIGRDLINDIVERSFRIAELALRGEDLSGLPLYPDDMPPVPERDALLAEIIERYETREAEIKAWLEKRHESH